jgi:hypothetical protein
MQRCVKFIDKYELEKLRNKLMVKLYRDIGRKYRSLIVDKEITLERFNKDFRKEIERNFDFSNPDYRKIFHDIEKLVLYKLARLPDRRRENIKEQYEIESKMRNINYDREEHFLFPEKVKNNRIRTEEGKRFEKNLEGYSYYEDYVNETHRRAIEEKIRKQLLNEDLRYNVTDREDKDVKASVLDEMLSNTLSRMDREEQNDNLRAKETFLKEKEILLSSFRCNLLILYRQS